MHSLKNVFGKLRDYAFSLILRPASAIALATAGWPHVIKNEGCPTKPDVALGIDRRCCSEDGLIVTMYYVYLLKSLQYPDKCYVGYTTNLKNRIKTHNSGGSVYTSAYRPWGLVTYLGFTAPLQARRFEQYLKSQSGRAFAKKRFW